MTKKEQLINKIIKDVKKNKSGYTSRKYITFFGALAMSKRRDLKTLSELDELFKSSQVSIWCGKDRIFQLENVKTGKTITFKNNMNDDKSKGYGTVEYAGKIEVSEKSIVLKPYTHQTKAYEKLQNKIIKSGKEDYSGLLVLPTGGGKTFAAAWWLSKNYLDKGKKVLWIAHRHELLNQAKSSFQKLAYKNILPNKKNIKYRIISGMHDQPGNINPTDDIIIASKDSLNAGFKYLKKNWIDQNNLDEVFLVIDEAHHATAKTYRKLISNLNESVSSLKILGLTATPMRTAENEKGLLKEVFYDDIVYQISLKELIKEDILSRPYFNEIKTGFIIPEELSETAIKNSKTFDISKIGGDFADAIAKNSHRNNVIVSTYLKNKEKFKQTLVFAVNIVNAIALNELFKKSGIKSEYVISSVKDAFTGVSSNFTKENGLKIKRYKKGETEVLINVNILTEGTDLPNTQTVFLTRPTSSTILMTQMIGRGLRGVKAGGTKEAHIISFVDNWKGKIAWVNPEQLYIRENVDFIESISIKNKEIARLIAISKIEEFAVLMNDSIDKDTLHILESIDFIKRIPLGIYQFKYLDETSEEPDEISVQILVYDNLKEAYENLIKALPQYAIDNNLEKFDFIPLDILQIYAKDLEVIHFKEVEKYPAYNIKDIESLLQNYIMSDELPKFIEFKERDKYNVDNIAKEIFDQNIGPKDATILVNKLWEDENEKWKSFFNYDKRVFSKEIGNSVDRLKNPEFYKNPIPKDIGEQRSFEDMSMHEISKYDSIYERNLRDTIFEKFKDDDGYYFSAISGKRFKSRSNFEVDHIIPISHPEGKTILSNIQLLTKTENKLKSDKIEKGTIS